MVSRKHLLFLRLILMAAAISLGIGHGYTQELQKAKKMTLKGKVKPAERKAAAVRARALGLKPGAGAVNAVVADPGGVPHYFGPYGNWAYSPLPKGAVTTITLTAPGSGYTNPLVTIDDVYATGTGATASVTGGTLGAIAAVTLTAGGTNYSAPIVTITDDPTLCGGAAQPVCGSGAAADATIGGVLTGGMRKFIDTLPGLGSGSANNLGQYIPIASPDQSTYFGSDYYEIGVVEFSEKMHSDLQPTRLRGYVQLSTATIPGKGIPLFQIDGTTPIYYPGTTTQVKAVDNPHYLGPTIVAKGTARGATDPARPARIKFYNLLPAGSGGDLFLPVDETVPGSGVGPSLPSGAWGTYTQNRATIHLHGNNTVWISDGNTHQWITPASENTPYPKGASVVNVPDMGTDCDAANSGCMTFYYTNAQSARLMFYHDHALGITRLNVYAGEAAGYVITDQVEQDMISGTNLTGVNPAGLKVLPDLGIPLVIQDRSFVEAATIFAQDPTWNWGTGARSNGKILGAVSGDLWYPHVYMSAQNPWDLTGTNAFGRWHYGPWFHPPVPECVNGLPVGCLDVGPVPNPYYQPDCDLVPPGPGCTAPWEPPLMPGVPNPSIAGEAFMDTPIVNGTAYPVLVLEPKAYRFRVLNASNDRMLNLQLYVAADKTTPTTPGTIGTVLCDPTPAAPEVCTEVKMVPVAGAPNQVADTPSGIPDPLTKGPDWIQIGTEGGFMPAPVLLPSQPVGYNMNATAFNVGNVNQHSLFVGSAERADVIADFTAYAGKTLILYNDAPAALPAGVPTYDYFTGVANQMDVGGAPTTQPGYGPNTRTIMQIQVGTSVSANPTTQVTLANLQSVFAKTATKRGVFEVSQEPIIIPQAAYNTAYNNTFPATAKGQFLQIADIEKTFQPINTDGVLQPATTLPLEQKAMHDEMGGVYDTQFGRMSGMLGLSNPLSPVHVLIPYGYASPPTDLVKGSIEGAPIAVFPDGTQIWRIFHNGVDTHTIHTHLFHAQLINRIGQDGMMLEQDPIELGWKDTFRVNPLEITFLAMRPTIPTPAQVPFDVPNSVRLIDPTLPEGATLIPPPPAGWFDPEGNAITQITNHYVNFGWEYVWHCHILAHEEMDMMHSLVFAVPPKAATNLQVSVQGGAATLTWTDNSNNESGFTIQRASDPAFTTGLTTFSVGAGITSYLDRSIQNNRTYSYRVIANNLVGDTDAYPAPSLGFPTMSADSALSNAVSIGNAGTTPAAPSNLTAVPQSGPQISLTWRDNANNETGFVVERCAGAACTIFTQIAAPGPRNNTGNVTFVDTTVTGGNSYSYRVAAVNASGSSAYTTVVSLTLPVAPAAPTVFRVSAVKATGTNYTATLNWNLAAGAVNPNDFTIQRATNLTFTTGLATFTAAGTARSLTQNVKANTTYYYRIRANNSGGSSTWRNALPFPIRTGP